MEHRIIIAIGFFLVSLNTCGQNAFKDFAEFQANKPSLTFNFELKKRTTGDIFMSGGTHNYRAKKITPVSKTEKLQKQVWGVIVGDTAYINSYPFLKLKGFNKILGKGYYSYFISEPARLKKEQVNLGIIQPHEKAKEVWGETGYVILPDGTIKHLSPEVLKDLCKDNEAISKEVFYAKLKVENVFEMFAFLDKYNATK